MSRNFASLLRPLLVAAACLWAGQAHAERWEDHRAAALRALEAVDYAKAIEQVEAAVYYARALPAADRDIAGLWENLAALSLADGQHGRAWDAIARWDRVLAANAGQAWAAKQQAHRDRMTRILFELARRESGEDAAAPSDADSGANSGANSGWGPAAPPAGAPNEAVANSSATDDSASAPPGVDLGPAAHDDAPSPTLGPADGTADGSDDRTADRTADGPAGAAIHLASYESEPDARRGWAELAARYPGLLGGKRPALKSVDLGDRGTFVRLMAVPFADSQAADAACAGLRRRAQYCAVVDAD